MKKKFLYIILAVSIFALNCSSVHAANFFSDGTKKDVCGLNLYSNVPSFTHGIFNAVKLLVPIILIIMGIVDFARAVSANDEKKMNESKDKFIRRLIAAIFIFFIVAIVQFVFKKVSTETGFTSCMNCILNNECKEGTENNDLLNITNNSTSSNNENTNTATTTTSNNSSTSGAGSLVQLDNFISPTVKNAIDSAVSTVKSTTGSTTQISDICSTCQNISDSVTRDACLKGCSKK